jgi:hypothetical protein
MLSKAKPLETPRDGVVVRGELASSNLVSMSRNLGIKSSSDKDWTSSRAISPEGRFG